MPSFGVHAHAPITYNGDTKSRMEHLTSTPSIFEKYGRLVVSVHWVVGKALKGF